MIKKNIINCKCDTVLKRNIVLHQTQLNLPCQRSRPNKVLSCTAGPQNVLSAGNCEVTMSSESYHGLDDRTIWEEMISL